MFKRKKTSNSHILRWRIRIHPKYLIITVFRRTRRNLSLTERQLKEAGVRCSRRWLKNFLEKWGETPV
jgi:hypothetical protein